jgi:hypothetical protein
MQIVGHEQGRREGKMPQQRCSEGDERFEDGQSERGLYLVVWDRWSGKKRTSCIGLVSQSSEDLEVCARRHMSCYGKVRRQRKGSGPLSLLGKVGGRTQFARVEITETLVTSCLCRLRTVWHDRIKNTHWSPQTLTRPKRKRQMSNDKAQVFWRPSLGGK